MVIVICLDLIYFTVQLFHAQALTTLKPESHIRLDQLYMTDEQTELGTCALKKEDKRTIQK